MNNQLSMAKANHLLTVMAILLITILTACASGQAPEAAKARSRTVINAGGIVPAEEIRVAEYLRYYEQNFPEPEQNTVGLDLRLGNSRIPVAGGIAWLQIGLQTKSADTDLVAPLNMDRIFREHVAGLKQRSASEVGLTVIPSPGVQLVGLTGLDTTPPAAGVNVPLPPMGTGDSTVVLAQLHVEADFGVSRSRPLATVHLHYFDESAQRPVAVEQVISAEVVANLRGYDPTWDLEVLRNVTIQQTAEGLREIDWLFDARQYETAWRLAVELENRLNEVARLTHDKQLLEDVGLLQRYQQTLADAVWQTEGRQPRMADTLRPLPAQQQPALNNAGRLPTATPPAPVVEIR